MKVTEAEKLITEFESLPKLIKDPTYLEICRYPRRRFEEICSRVLSFYFLPKNEHGFGNLFLRSLLKLANEEISFNDDDIKVLSEENADGKRLDLLIYSPDFAIGIENKITASVYNPLEAYSNRIGHYHSQKVIKILLSLWEVKDKDELELIERNGFINLTYIQLFEAIKQNVGYYLNNSNNKYLIFLIDFIQTLENMEGQNILNDKLSDYFFDNSNRIEDLIDLYNKHKSQILNIQSERISELRSKIFNETKDPKWWIWGGRVLGINEFHETKLRIGIESYYKQVNKKPLGLFIITITAWDLKDWAPFETQIMNTYKLKQIKKENNRPFLTVKEIEDDNEAEILYWLKHHYEYLKSLIV